MLSEEKPRRGVFVAEETHEERMKRSLEEMEAAQPEDPTAATRVYPAEIGFRNRPKSFMSEPVSSPLVVSSPSR
jgi:hypothetical protein